MCSPWLPSLYCPYYLHHVPAGQLQVRRKLISGSVAVGVGVSGWWDEVVAYMRDDGVVYLHI